MTLRVTACLLIIVLVSSSIAANGQVIIQPPGMDTTRLIQIVRANSLREKMIDSVTRIQTLAGNVVVREGTTVFSMDSAAINRSLNTVEAFGNVHINESDSIHTYAQYLRYVGNERKAYLRKNVRLTDRNGVLTTQELDYDMASGIGIYRNGGRIVNKGTVLTSREGTYFSDTKDVFFRNNVRLKNPKYDISADSMDHNITTEVVNFRGPTYIKSKEAEVFTRSGYYDLKQGKAFFGNNPLITDSSGRKYRAENIAMDEKSNTAQLEGNAVVIDSANGFTLTGGQIFLNQKNNSFLATRKPVLIIQQKDDSTFIAADTLFSGVMERTALAKNKPRSTPRPGSDTVRASILKDSTTLNERPADSLALSQATDTIITADNIQPKANSKVNGMDTIRSVKRINASDSTVRYFLAFAHVRIFNDSLQAVCDSLSYSGEDSVFRMFKNPVTWSGQNQITGDTLYLFTKNKKAEQLQVFENAMVINRTTAGFFNQIGGRNLNGYFINGNIDYMRVKGTPASSIYYIQDKDSAYTGMNRASGSVIDLYFVNKELRKVLFVNDVKGTMFPIRKIPEDQKQLNNFSWQDKRRPKNRLELFE